MNVIPIEGEPFRFRVQSRSRSKMKHLVDLLENRGSGRCDCEHHQFTKDRCAHIKEAREFLVDEVIRRVLAAERTQKEEAKANQRIR